jgi:hypothetical protein
VCYCTSVCIMKKFQMSCFMTVETSLSVEVIMSRHMLDQYLAVGMQVLLCRKSIFLSNFDLIEMESIIAVVLLALLSPAAGFYVPGVAPRDYEKNDEVDIKVYILFLDLNVARLLPQVWCTAFHLMLKLCVKYGIFQYNFSHYMILKAGLIQE